MKKITYGEFIDAIERDGLPKATGTLFRTKRGGSVIPSLRLYQRRPSETIGAACAVGQACINLGIRDAPTPDLTELAIYIIRQNDKSGATLEEIARKARNRFKDKLDTTFNAQEFDYSPYLNMALYNPKELPDASTR